MPDPDPAKHAQYMARVDSYRRDLDQMETLSKFSTPSDILNTLLSLPGTYTAQQKGMDIETARKPDLFQGSIPVVQNVLGTGESAGLLSFRDAAQFGQKLMDNGIKIDDEDARTYRTGWSPEQYMKYDKQLREQGTSLAKVMVEDGLNWTQVSAALDLMRFSKEDQQVIADSLGYETKEETPTKVVKRTPISLVGTGMPVYKDEQIDEQYNFSVSNPDKIVTYDDLGKMDYGYATLGLQSNEEIADLIITKYAIAQVARYKTAGFQDFLGSVMGDPTNFGKLQLLWSPVGKVFEGAVWGAKKVGGAAVKHVAGSLDLQVGMLTQMGKLLKKAGDKSVGELFDPADFTKVSDYVKYVGRETAQSTMWKSKNNLFFGLQSALKQGAKTDGGEAADIIMSYLPKIQQGALSGDWSAFRDSIKPGAARYVSNAIGDARNSLIAIGKDEGEDALNRFVGSFSSIFEDTTPKEVEQIKALVKQGDLAGLLRVSLDKHLAESLGEVEGLSLKDMFNHVVSAYGDGLRVLSEKSLGTFDDPETARLAQQFNSLSSSLRQVWTSSVLTARTGYNIINYMDNAFRVAMNGFNPVKSAVGIERELIEGHGFTAAQVRDMIGSDIRESLDTARESLTIPQAMSDKLTELYAAVGKSGNEAEVKKLLGEVKAANTGLPYEVKQEVTRRLNELTAAISQQQQGVLTVGKVRRVIGDVRSGVYERQVGAEDRIFKPVTQTLRELPGDAFKKFGEYSNLIRNGEYLKVPKNFWDDWVGAGRAAHNSIESAAKIRVFGGHYLERYTQYTKRILAEGVPELGNPELQSEIRAAIVEAVRNPGKFADAQAIINRALETKSVRAATHNWLVSFMPALEDGSHDYLEPFTNKMATWMEASLSGDIARNPALLESDETWRAAIKRAQDYVDSRSKLEMAEPLSFDRLRQINEPTMKTVPAIQNELSAGRVFTSDPARVVERLNKASTTMREVVDEILNANVHAKNTQYNLLLDTLSTKVPNEVRLGRHAALRDAFVEHFAGDATVAGQPAKVIGAELPSQIEKMVGGKTVKTSDEVMLILEDGRRLPASQVYLNSPEQRQYYQQYENFAKTRFGVKQDVLGHFQGMPGAIPDEVASAYIKKLEANVGEHLGIPKSAEVSGVKRTFVYDTPEQLAEAFKSGSGLTGTHSAGADLVEGLNRITDNWLYTASLVDVSSLDDVPKMTLKIGAEAASFEDYMRHMKRDINDPADIRTTMNELVTSRNLSVKSGDKSLRVKVTIEHKSFTGKNNPLSNDPMSGLSMLDVSRSMWKDYADRIMTETRGQWIPTFNPNLEDGKHIVLVKNGEDLPIMVERGTAIPDSMAEHLSAIEDAKESLEEFVDGTFVEPAGVGAAIPEPKAQPINVEAEVAAYVDAPDPYAQFTADFPKLRSREDFLDRVKFLRARKSTNLTDEQAKAYLRRAGFVRPAYG